MESKEEQIDHYLLGLLGEKEKLAFEDALKQTPGLVEEVKDRQVIIDAIQTHGRAMERSIFKAWDEEAEEKPIRLYRNKWLVVAASIVIILIPGYLLFFNDYEDLYASHYSPFPNYVISSTRGGDSYNAILNKAFTHYDAGEWQLASQALSQALNNDPKNLELTFYLALSLQAYQQHEEALSYFDMIASTEFKYANALHWYKALSLVALKRESEAAPLLRSMALDASSTYAKKASQLLEEL
ncbi:MAG: hypothetical protein AAGC88_05525 [Bacteroidota bacterium]